jgi:hypothetical protein
LRNRSKKEKLGISLAGLGTRQAKVEGKMVANPLHLRAHDGEKWNPKEIKAAVNLKESALVVLEQRGSIDEAQVKAGERFRSIWEALGGAGTGAFDYSREPVDGGGAREALSERQIRAGQDLAEARKVLGIGYDVMVKVAGEGLGIPELTDNQSKRRAYSEYLKDGLSALAKHWGYENRGTKRNSL